MGPCYAPSLSNRQDVLRELRECRTFAYDHVMERGAQELEKLEASLQEIANLTPEMIDVLPLDQGHRSTP